MMSEKIINMPKIDLHCHLDGSLTVESVRELLGREVASEELQADEKCASLADYLKKFDLPLSCLQNEGNIRRLSKEFLLSLQKDHVQYAEVRFAPQLSTNQGMCCKKVMEAVLDGLEDAKHSCGIHYGVIVCMMRHHSEEQNLQMLKECREFLGEGLVAADLAGDEAGFPTKEFYELFRTAKRMDYPFTIHAGECGDVNSILMAAEWGASRIGHGIAMRGNPQVQEICRKKRIAVEMCPVSNYQTKALAAGSIYPIREFARNGVLVTVNTDNRTVSGTSITKELCFLQENFGITEEEFLQYQLNGIEAAFCDDSIKQELWKGLQK